MSDEKMAFLRLVIEGGGIERRIDSPILSNGKEFYLLTRDYLNLNYLSYDL
jgi:hypothetical protein